ncbi:hypothetical protein [uncultured Leclercia sp.]|uniref:pPIWI-associating nuclease domain-containing protein n=2 Tax=Enterobacterales TaxID=91347 RepID=UPI00338E343E
MSTHQYIEEITAEKISVVKIGVSSMRMHIDGSIGSLLMYGSASDRRKGDGAEIPASFPVYSEMEVLFKQPLGSSINLNKFSVDITTWYE